MKESIYLAFIRLDLSFRDELPGRYTPLFSFLRKKSCQNFAKTDNKKFIELFINKYGLSSLLLIRGKLLK